MKKTTRTLVTALTAGVAGLALTAPLAMAAPTPTPSAPVKSTATSKPPTTSKPAAKLTLSVTAPASATSPAKVRVTGITSDEVIVEAFLAGSSRVVSVGDAWGFKNGSASFDIPAPKGGWVPGATYTAKLTANAGTVLTDSFTVPGGKATGNKTTGTKTTGTKTTGGTASKDNAGGLAKTGV